MTEVERSAQVKSLASRKKKAKPNAPGLAGNESKAELKGIFRNQIRDWFLQLMPLTNSDYPLAWLAAKCARSLNFYRIKDDQVIEAITSEDIIYELIDASIREAPLWGPDFSWAEKEAKECFAQIKSQILAGRANGLLVDEDEIKPIRWLKEPGYCFHRLPFERKITREMKGTDFREAKIGQALQTMIEACPDYNSETGESLSMTRLFVWLGIVLTGEVSIKEMLTLVSDGNDGKTTFLEALQENLGGEVVVKLGQDIEEICDKHQKVQILNKRIFHFEEPKSGHLITAALKRVVGSQVIEGRFLYKDSMNFQNRACFIVSTNKPPKIDGSRAHKSRLRIVKLGAVPDGLRMLPEQAKADIKENWEEICRTAYRIAAREHFVIPENTEDELDESVSQFFSKADSIIDEVFCVEQGAFMPLSLVAAICERQRVSTDDVRQRLLMRYPELAWKKARVPKTDVAARRIAPVWGFENLGFLPESWAWQSENFHRRYKKSGQKED